MATQPYEFLARYAGDGTVAGAYIKNLEVENGRAREGEQLALADTSDPAYAQFAADFSAAVIAQRDALAADKLQLEDELAAMTAERDELTGARDALAEDKASLAAERDVLLEQVATLTSERDEALAQVEPLQAQVTELTAQLDALQNPPVNPRHVAPFDFIALFTAEELYAVMTSVDPMVIVGRTKLQTIITYVDLDLADTVNLVGYLEQIGLIAEGRAAQILAGEAPAE